MTPHEMLDRAVALYNAHDWDGLTAMWSPDAEIRVPGGAKLRGGADWASYNRVTVESFSDARVEVDHVIVEGNAVVQISRMIGTHDGPYRSRDGTVIEPTGRHVEIPYTEIFWVRDDVVTRVDLYLDPADTPFQLGHRGP